MADKLNIEILFTPLKVGRLNLPNRIAMAPLTRKRATREMIPTDIMVTYYEQRAEAGLIITEATNINPMALGYTFTPGIFTREQVKAWAKITDAVHKKGGFIYCQLWHVGRHSHPELLDGKMPLAPSAVREQGHVTTYTGRKNTVVPKAMTLKEIKDTINDFGKAARNAISAGFDGVEIHGANGYLIDQFIQSSTNRRNDEYGGEVKNRIRFALEVVEKVAHEIGSDRTAIRLSPSGTKLDMYDENPKETFGTLITKLNDYNLSYLHLLEPWFDVSDKPHYPKQVAAFFRPYYKGILMANNGFTAITAADAIQKGIADMVSFGKLFISNPDLITRFKLGAPLNPWNEKYFYSGGEKGYIDYPFYQIPKTNNK